MTAESTWPGWLRRRSGVELLGPPRLFFAWLAIALSLFLVAYVGAWNANHYPTALGYDATEHMTYAHNLLHNHQLPSAATHGEYNTPPAYYFLAGLAASAGHRFFGWHEADGDRSIEPSYRGAQYLNVVFELLTALCILWLALRIAPRSPGVWAGAVGFFALLPVVSKTAAMFHPENLNMLTSAAAVAAATDLLITRKFRRWVIAVLIAGIVIGMLTRTSAMFTVFAIAIGFAVVGLSSDVRSRLPWGRIAVVAAIVALFAVSWIGRQVLFQHQQPFGNGGGALAAALHPGSQGDPAARSHFFGLTVADVFRTPFRPTGRGEALAQNFMDTWGDWYGSFAWSSYSNAPWQPALVLLKDQMWIGVLPSIAALLGLFVLLAAAIRRRALLPLALLAPIAIAGYLYRSYVVMSPDADVLKPTYILTTTPAWAIGFGLVVAWLGARGKLMRYGIVGLLLIFAVIELRFTMYGIRDHRAIF